MNPPADLVDALLAAPLGVATLARLEWRATDEEMPGSEPASTPTGVETAVALVRSMDLAELIDLALWALMTDVGPWIGDAPSSVAAAYRHGEARRPIAAAVAERFGDELHRPLGVDAQQWWVSAVDRADRTDRADVDAPLFGDLYRVYGAGQFTWAGLWTVTDPAPALHEPLFEVHEMYPGPIVRWHLPVRPDARVFEIHRPDDWVRLVAEHPAPAQPGQEQWELPGPDRPPSTAGAPRGSADATDRGEQPKPPTSILGTEPSAGAGSARRTDEYGVADGGGWFRYLPDAQPAAWHGGGWAAHPGETGRVLPAELVDSPHQHAARVSMRRHLVPDWASVAREWDGVHLSWAGLLTTEGFVSDLPGGDVAMLRYWFSERTMWLADVFGEPEPLGAAEIPARVVDGLTRPGALDLRTDTAAHERERWRLARLLGR